MKQITHVNQHHIRSNLNALKADPNATLLPVITVKSHNIDPKTGLARKTPIKNEYYKEVEIVDNETKKVMARLVYSPDAPQPCGARLWIETDTNDVTVRGFV